MHNSVKLLSYAFVHDLWIVNCTLNLTKIIDDMGNVFNNTAISFHFTKNICIYEKAIVRFFPRMYLQGIMSILKFPSQWLFNLHNRFTYPFSLSPIHFEHYFGLNCPLFYQLNEVIVNTFFSLHEYPFKCSVGQFQR